MAKNCGRIAQIKGFTSIELVMTLIILTSMMFGIIHFSQRSMDGAKEMAVATNATSYAGNAALFIQTYAMALTDALTDNNDSENGKVITIPAQILAADGFIPSNYPAQNSLEQYPCVVVTYKNQQLNAYLYFRSDRKTNPIRVRDLHAGLEHVGGMIGLYQPDGTVTGAGHMWSMSADETRALFIAKGQTEPQIGFGRGEFSCPGNNIAANSFVINLASILNTKTRLPNDGVINQYPDPMDSLGSSGNRNTINGDLNMNFKDQHSAIIFQQNPNCVMDPNNEATMQDYDPKFDGANPENERKANNLGCRSKQLSIVESQDIAGNPEMLITGFQQGGDQAAYDNYNKVPGRKIKIQRPFVGELKAQAFQATIAIPIGTPCEAIAIGTIARQAKTSNPNDVNNLYVSQVVCMKNPLCPAATNGICYMPANSVTITYTIPTVKNDKPGIVANAIKSAICPAGLALVDYTDDHENPPDWGRRICSCFLGVCAYAEAHDHNFDGYSFSYLANTDPNTKPFKNGLKLGLVHYRYSCDAACNCPGDDAAQWQPQVTSIICSNDMNRVPVETNLTN